MNEAKPWSRAAVAALIDHTLLKPEALPADFDRLCDEALRYGFCSVCVASSRVAYVAGRLRGTAPKVCSVVGFPHGNMASAAKAFEARQAVAAGAVEIDMVINVGFLKARELAPFEADISAVREAAGPGVILKVIIETVFLSKEEKVLACEIAARAGADFVKTCTGFSGGGATVEDIALMRSVVGPKLGVKASGGIRTWGSAVGLLGAGASRLGCASSVAVMTDQEATGSY